MGERRGGTVTCTWTVRCCPASALGGANPLETTSVAHSPTNISIRRIAEIAIDNLCQRCV